MASFYLSAFEKRLTAKPVFGDPSIDTGSNPQNQQAEDGTPNDR
jgi:hypothetical protein